MQPNALFKVKNFLIFFLDFCFEMFMSRGLHKVNIHQVFCKLTRSVCGSEIMSETKPNIQHDAKSNVFLLNLPECADKSYISYEWINDSAVDLQHTFVPESMRGQGIAKQLAKFVFDYVADNNMQMKLSCWYLQKYLKEHPKPEYTVRVIDDGL